jgi:hypothetical protein
VYVFFHNVVFGVLSVTIFLYGKPFLNDKHLLNTSVQHNQKVGIPDNATLCVTHGCDAQFPNIMILCTSLSLLATAYRWKCFLVSYLLFI